MKALLLTLMASSMIIAIQSCTTMNSENDDYRKICDIIIRNPDTLHVLQFDKNIMDVDPAFKYSLSSNIEHIKRYFSNGYGNSNRKKYKGFLDYEFYGDLYTAPGTTEPTPAYICFVFDKHWWECKWKLIIIRKYDPEKNSNDHSE